MTLLPKLSGCKAPGSRPLSSPRFLFIGCLLFYLFFALAGCTRQPDRTPAVKRFVEQTRQDFQILEKRLAPVLDRNVRDRRVDEVVAGFFGDAGALAGRNNLGIAVLDAQMNYIAGRVLSEDRSGPEPIQTGLKDFSYLGDIFETARSGIAQQALYFKGRPILTACSAIGAGGDPAAYVCLFYDAQSLSRQFGIDKQTFVEIDFSR